MPHELATEELVSRLDAMARRIESMEAALRDLAQAGTLTRGQLERLSAEGGYLLYLPPPSESQAARLVRAGPAGKGKEKEQEVPPWRHLVRRPHPWRSQLSLRGRNMTVRQLLGTMTANKWKPETAAENLDLPVEAIREAQLYAQKNRELLALETAYENYLLDQKEASRGSPVVPG
jgi:uncharacterized protein (DUF433 family)